MTDQPAPHTQPEPPPFGDGWEPHPKALRVVARYLLNSPEQGDWDLWDHCEGVAGGILSDLHEAGFDV